MLGYTPRWAC